MAHIRSSMRQMCSTASFVRCISASSCRMDMSFSRSTGRRSECRTRSSGIEASACAAAAAAAAAAAEAPATPAVLEAAAVSRAATTTACEKELLWQPSFGELALRTGVATARMSPEDVPPAAADLQEAGGTCTDRLLPTTPPPIEAPPGPGLQATATATAGVASRVWPKAASTAAAIGWGAASEEELNLCCCLSCCSRLGSLRVEARVLT
mmetsp:Transcript_60435/g.173362  ORF Transcript_60435/g.173362 Transcript_60435/m.173362 type:complete len:210 (-) Transcript_60435:201-830(-)